MTDILPPARPSASVTVPDPVVPGPPVPAPVVPAPRATGARPAGERPAPKQRDAYFDNVKFFLIMLVVLGHCWEVFRNDSHAVNAAYSLVYGFHMPVFVFVSGYFSRSFMKNTEKFRVIFPTLVVPYVIFDVLYRLQLVAIRGNEFSLHDLFRPQFLMWFLVALVFWRLSAPLWAHLRHPVAVSVALCLVAGSWSFNSDSTLCRTAGLLPFFVLGLTVRRDRVEALRGPGWTRWAGAAVLLAALPIAYVWQLGSVLPKVERGVLLWNRGYEHMGFGALEGMAYRLLALGIAAVLGMAFLAAVPRGRAWFTELGTRTMYVYLLHGLVVKTLDYGGLLDGRFFQTPLGLLLVTAGGIALGLLLATVPVQRLTRWAVEPNGRWLLKPSHGGT